MLFRVMTYVDVLCKDTGLSVAELRSLMVDRELWAETVRTSSSKDEML